MAVIGAGEYGTIVMRIGDQEISVWKELTLTSDFLSDTDRWSGVVGDEELAPAIRRLLVPGKKVQFLIDGAPQFTGYLTAVRVSADRSSGTDIRLEGYDAFWPLNNSQIDPNKKYPEKTPLSKLIEDTLRDEFGFTHFAIDNEANVDVAANKRHPRRRRKRKPLNQYKLPKKKPDQNDTYMQWLSRFLNRVGLWFWPTVDGTGVVVSTPDFDQDPRYTLRRKANGQGNNIQSGGVDRDCCEQPLYIVVRGSVPAKTAEHGRTRVVIDNPYVVGMGVGLSFQEDKRTTSERLEDNARGQGATPQVALGIAQAEQEQRLGRRLPTGLNLTDASTVTTEGVDERDGAARANDQARGQTRAEDASLGESRFIAENQTFISYLERAHHTVVDHWTQIIPVAPIRVANPYAPSVAMPRYLTDRDSHTLEELEHFARRQMSLCTRKAVVGNFVIPGLKLDGQMVQPDTIVSIDDDASDFHDNMWVLARTFRISRSGGVTTQIQTIPINSIVL